jgi:methylisocitrate lyase
MDSKAVLRGLIEEPGLVFQPYCYDALSARIAENLGFRAVGLGGWSLGAHTCITEPLLTMTENLKAAKSIVNAINIPLIVDAGAGYGEPMHVTRTVEEFERIGVAAIHIEDQIFPKRAHYHRSYQERIISREQMAEKIRYACEARDNPDFVIIARTDSAHTHGPEEAVTRGNAYARAGADMIMVFPDNPEQAEDLPRRIEAPLIYVNSPGNLAERPMLTVGTAEELGYKLLSDAIALSIVTAQAVKKALQNYLRRGGFGMDPECAKSVRGEIEELIGLPRYYEIEEETTEKK